MAITTKIYSQLKAFWHTLTAVLWAFIGIRKNSSHQKDQSLNPIHLVVIAILLTIAFIYGLLAIVSYAIKG